MTQPHVSSVMQGGRTHPRGGPILHVRQRGGGVPRGPGGPPHQTGVDLFLTNDNRLRRLAIPGIQVSSEMDLNLF